MSGNPLSPARWTILAVGCALAGVLQVARQGRDVVSASGYALGVFAVLAGVLALIHDQESGGREPDTPGTGRSAWRGTVFTLVVLDIWLWFR